MVLPPVSFQWADKYAYKNKPEKGREVKHVTQDALTKHMEEEKDHPHSLASRGVASAVW